MPFPKGLKIAPLLVAPLGLLSLGLYEARQGLTLKSFNPLPDERLPGLSIVIAARDEAESIEKSLSSLLEQDYPRLQVIVVDDRSSDGTSDIVRKVKEQHPRSDRLTIIHNQELPEGWLGKVHALHLGVQATCHPLILLTDGDIIFSRDALRRAVTAQQVLGADHMAVAPRFEIEGFWEPTLVAYFFILFVARFQPSTVHRKKHRFVGVGAFNMVTRQLLEKMDWLKPLRLQVVDDLHLGLLAKSRGGRQFALLGQESVSVRWFRGLAGVVRGLEKNAYAGLNYNLPFAIAASLAAASPFWSIALIWLQGGWTWAVAWYAFQVLLGALASLVTGLPVWSGLAFPLASLVIANTKLRSALLAEWRGAIHWRGTAYSLEQLRQAHSDFLAQERL